MRKNRLFSLLLAAFLMTSLAATPALSETAQPGTLTDMKGREIHMDAPATRVVVLAASDCEILYALGAGNKLVGRGEYCDFPEEVAAIPAVQSGSETNIEQILALNPQAVIMDTMAQAKDQVAALEAAGIPVVVTDAQTIEGTYTAISLIGAVTGKTAEAETLVNSMKTTFADIAAKVTPNSGKTVYFEVSPLQWGLWTAGSGTFMDELANLLGLTNAFADVQGWGEISQEQVLERDPDYIVTVAMYTGEGLTPVEEITAREGWQDLKAVKNGEVYNAIYNEIARPGPRLVDAAHSLYQFVYEPETLKPAA